MRVHYPISSGGSELDSVYGAGVRGEWVWIWHLVVGTVPNANPLSILFKNQEHQHSIPAPFW